MMKLFFINIHIILFLSFKTSQNWFLVSSSFMYIL